LIRQGWKSEEAYRRADFLLAEIGLGEKVQRLAARLSGGEQQRVAVARALAGCPSAVLADEPTGNLDAANADSIFQLLLDLARRDRAAVLLVTHNRELAERCDRTLEMRDGRFS
jgi:lipoprotein-releasing system ATP-binding protein